MKNKANKNGLLSRLFRGDSDQHLTLEDLPKKPSVYRIKWWHFWKLGTKIDQNDLDCVIDILPFREEALEEGINGLRRLKTIAQELELTDDQLFVLAATDVFVEKAQRVLTRRSRSLYIGGIITTNLIFLILGAAIYFVIQQVEKGVPAEVIDSTQALIFRIFQSIALSAFVFVGLKLLLSLSRSLFHEALTLLERRHALRYGRLFVYLKKGDIDDKQLNDAFQWNKETRTSFLDMKPEVISETLFHKILDTIGKLPPETLKALSETRKNIKADRL